MSNTSPFVRKIIYIACIGALLIPLSMISRPETRDADGKIDDGGGQLSILREKNDLSQAKMSEIDPASETMKLASLGLRGVAVNMLWMQAMDHKKKENYEQLASTLQALTKIQPNFVKVWEYQAHNMAYNVSMEFDDYEYRYHWVKKGISFLKQGIDYNKRDHRISDNLGMFTGYKFGKSDEKNSFRRMFRKDDEFHQSMADRIDPDSYNQLGYGPDSWKMSYQWYDFSRMMVEEQGCPQRRNDMLFYMYQPAQLRNQALSLQEEYRTDEIIQNIWGEAFEQWLDYGNQEISNSMGVTVKLEGLPENESKLESLRKQLDELVPDGKELRQDFMTQMMAQAKLSEEEEAVMALASDERTDEQNQLYRKVSQILQRVDKDLDARIAFEASDEDQNEANKLVFEILKIQNEISVIDRDNGTVNYTYWRVRNEAESKDMTARARQALFDAEEMWRQSIYDDEYDFDYKTKEKTITKRGAITLYLDAYAKWAEVLRAYPRLTEGHLAKGLIQSMQQYLDMLIITNREWPDDFPLQFLVDERYERGETDGLPTSEYLEERRTGREEEAGDGAAKASSEGEKPSKESTGSANASDEDDASGSDESKVDEDGTADKNQPDSKADSETSQDRKSADDK